MKARNAHYAALNTPEHKMWINLNKNAALAAAMELTQTNMLDLFRVILTAATGLIQ